MAATFAAPEKEVYLVGFFLDFFRTLGLSLSGLGDVVSPAFRASVKRLWISASLYMSSCERLGINHSMTLSSKDIFGVSCVFLAYFQGFSYINV
jgi:hypothetical protein